MNFVRHRLILAAMLVLAGIPFQSLMAHRCAALGGQPDLWLLTALTFAAFFGPGTGAGMGFVAGVLSGCLGGDSLGVAIVSRTLAGYGAGTVVSRWLQPGWASALAATFSGSVVEAAGFLLASPRPGGFEWLLATLASAVLNTCLAVPLTWCLSRSFRGEIE